MDETRQTMRQVRSIASHFTTREDGESPIIEGYFAVFNSIYQITDYMTESIAPGAFSNTLGEDVRALVNHNPTLVLGRTTAGTLELRQDDKGLWGRIKVNPNDRDAMNLYERVKRGDVDQCSFGFDITDEEPAPKPDGSVHWLIKAVRLYEVSCVTFPAYEDTNITARSKERDAIRAREAATWRARQKEALHGIKSTDVKEKD